MVTGEKMSFNPELRNKGLNFGDSLKKPETMTGAELKLELNYIINKLVYAKLILKNDSKDSDFNKVGRFITHLRRILSKVKNFSYLTVAEEVADEAGNAGNTNCNTKLLVEITRTLAKINDYTEYLVAEYENNPNIDSFIICSDKTNELLEQIAEFNTIVE